MLWHHHMSHEPRRSYPRLHDSQDEYEKPLQLLVQSLHVILYRC